MQGRSRAPARVELGERDDVSQKGPMKTCIILENGICEKIILKHPGSIIPPEKNKSGAESGVKVTRPVGRIQTEADGRRPCLGPACGALLQEEKLRE